MTTRLHTRPGTTIIRIFFLLACIVAGGSVCRSQPFNRVYNPSFEFKTRCPDEISGGGALPYNKMALCMNWGTLTTAGTPDYFNACNTNVCTYSTPTDPTVVGVPDNLFGHQAASGGSAYSGIILDVNEHVEYVQGELIPLEAGKTYFVSFYVSLGEGAHFGVKNLGAYLSTGAYFQSGHGPISLSATYVAAHGVVNGSAVMDKSNWVQISGYYTAGSGGEDHIVIGYFGGVGNLLNDTTRIPASFDCYGDDTEYGYYYIDDVSVTEVMEASPCSCGDPHYGVVLVPQSSTATQCCMQVQVGNRVPGCPIYGIRVRPGSISLDPVPFINGASGSWTMTTSSSAFVREWTSGDPLLPGESVTVGQLCINPNSAILNVIIDYLDALGNVMCSDTVAHACVDYCCDHQPDPVIHPLDISNPDHDFDCCFSLELDPKGFCKRIAKLLISRVGSGAILDQNNPGAGPQSHVEIGLNEEFVFSAEFCLLDVDDVDQTLQIDYLDANGVRICSRDIEVTCGRDPDDCCSHIAVDIEPGTPLTGFCCYNIEATIPGLCDIMSMKLIPVFPAMITSGSDPWVSSLTVTGPVNDVFRKDFCIKPAGTSTSTVVNIEFRSENGTLICTKQVTVECESTCCDNLILQEIMPPPVPYLDPCCSSIHLNALEGACDVYGIRVNGTWVAAYDSTNLISIPAPPTPNRIFTWCVTVNTTETLTVEIFDREGRVSCVKKLIRECIGQSPGGGGGSRRNLNPDQPAIAADGYESVLTLRPNPTRDRVTLGYVVREEGRVVLEVYDARGERVAALGNEQRKAGTYELFYDTSMLPSGEYVVKLTRGNEVVTERLTVAR